MSADDQQAEALLRQFADLAEGRLDAEAAAALDTRLAADASARRLYMEWMNLQMELESGGWRQQAAPAPRRLGLWLAAAAGLALTGLIWLATARSSASATVDKPSESVANPDVALGFEVYASAGATWRGEAGFGQMIPAGRTLVLESGIVTFGEPGLRCTVEGPAQFRCEQRKFALTSGKMLIQVSDAAGVAIETPSATLTDLGTTFGVAVTATDELCHVYEGRVLAQSKWGEAGSREIDAGQALSLRPTVGGLFGASRNADWLAFGWEAIGAHGVRAIAGNVRIAATLPTRFAAGDPIVTTPERVRTLSQPLLVDAAAPGRYQGPFPDPTTALQPGRRLRSYAAHFAPGRYEPPRESRVAVLEFDEPVAAIICTPNALAASAALFAGDDANPQRLDPKAFSSHLALEHEDGIVISDDRKRVVIYFETWLADEIRILTEAHLAPHE